MPDSGGLTEKYFINFLAKISPESDSREQSLAYLRLHDLLVRFFRLKGDIAPENATDLTLDRVAEKINGGAEINNLQSFTFGVARNIFHERFRTESKKQKAEQEFEQQRQLNSPVAEDDDLRIFRECYRALSKDERELLQNYFAEKPQKNNWREHLAESLNLSIDNLRLRIFRLRQRLEKCVRQKLK